MRKFQVARSTSAVQSVARSGKWRDNQSGVYSIPALLLLDKDGIIEPFTPAKESDDLPKPPNAKEFSNCCNEFWLVSTYIANGLWRKKPTPSTCLTKWRENNS
jgi:hypothetical protein